MRISEQWLREWVAPRLTTRELAHVLTMAGLEVGSCEPVAPDLARVVVGEILSVMPHPDASKLKCCRVSIGKAKSLQVVCGAPDVTVGHKVPVALAGSVLANGVTVTRSDIRGATSEGVLCSGAELGLEDASIGLYLLGREARPGEPDDMEDEHAQRHRDVKRAQEAQIPSRVAQALAVFNEIIHSPLFHSKNTKELI